MIGDHQYCKKYGHDWTVCINMPKLGGIVYECRICGEKQIMWAK